MGEQAALTELEAKIMAAVVAARHGRAPASTIRVKVGLRQTLNDSALLAQTLNSLVSRRLLALSLMGCFRFFHLPPPPVTAAELSAPPEEEDEELPDPGKSEKDAAAILWRQRMAGTRWHDDPRAAREGSGTRKEYLTPPFYNTPIREI